MLLRILLIFNIFGQGPPPKRRSQIRPLAGRVVLRPRPREKRPRKPCSFWRECNTRTLKLTANARTNMDGWKIFAGLLFGAPPSFQVRSVSFMCRIPIYMSLARHMLRGKHFCCNHIRDPYTKYQNTSTKSKTRLFPPNPVF